MLWLSGGRTSLSPIQGSYLVSRSRRICYRREYRSESRWGYSLVLRVCDPVWGRQTLSLAMDYIPYNVVIATLVSPAPSYKHMSLAASSEREAPIPNDNERTFASPFAGHRSRWRNVNNPSIGIGGGKCSVYFCSLPDK